MEKILILTLIIFIIISFFQYRRIKDLRKNWSPNHSDYLNDVPRNLKEYFIAQISFYLEKRNIEIHNFLNYIREGNSKELESIVEIILDQTSLVKLFLPKDQKVLSFDGKDHYVYRIGANTKFSNLLKGFEGSSRQYAYNFDKEYSREDLIKILEQDPTLKDDRVNARIHFLVVQNNKLYYSDTFWWNTSEEPYWWPLGLVSLDKISDQGLQHSLRKRDHVLILPKKIEK